jgi:hypothetical protein
VSPVVANPFKGIDKPFAAVQPLMMAEHRIWVLGMRPSSSLASEPEQQESLVLLRYFTRTAVRGYRGMWLTLWVICWKRLSLIIPATCSSARPRPFRCQGPTPW